MVPNTIRHDSRSPVTHALKTFFNASAAQLRLEIIEKLYLEQGSRSLNYLKRRTIEVKMGNVFQ